MKYIKSEKHSSEDNTYANPWVLFKTQLCQSAYNNKMKRQVSSNIKYFDTHD